MVGGLDTPPARTNNRFCGAVALLMVEPEFQIDKEHAPDFAVRTTDSIKHELVESTRLLSPAFTNRGVVPQFIYRAFRWGPRCTRPSSPLSWATSAATINPGSVSPASRTRASAVVLGSALAWAWTAAR